MEDNSRQSTVFDADQQHIGDVYAKALLAVGQGSGNVDQLVDELDSVVDAIGQLPKFAGALESPRVPVAAKESMLQKAFGGKVTTELLNFLKVLARKGRFDCLAAICGSTHRMHDEAAGRAQATLTTAAAVDESVIRSVAQRLEKIIGRQVALTPKVDPEIIGGMIVRVGDTVYDGSVANQLGQVRSRAIKAASDSIRSSLDRFATETN